MSVAGSPLIWGIFALVVVAALAVDLGFFNRTAHEPTLREAGAWVSLWVALAGGFNAYVIYQNGWAKGMEFTQGYLLELALSTDNLFVFILIFSYFRIPRAYQHRILFWGIVGAVVTRGIFITVGAAVIHRFHWILYLLGAFLLYAAVKIVVQKDADIDPSRNPVLRLFRRLVRMAEDEASPRFVVRREGKLFATPLLAVLIVVEAVDVTFAVDSIPAIFGVTTDVFIVLTSNIFAVLGLRSLYFLVAGLTRRLTYLNYGIAAVLAFIGLKIVSGPWLRIPVLVSLFVVLGLLVVATVASLLARQRLSK
jgi:tellurite resistance protein TerC